MTSGKSKIILGLLAMLGLPCTALANAGTPLMWGAFGHLALGNIFIGLLEGNILRCRNSGKGYSEVAMMIGANYFSAFCGCFIIGGLDALWICRWTLLNLKANFIFMVVLLWFATVLLEWPFVWLAMDRELRRWGKALKFSFAVQSVSYVLLVGWYILCGNHSLLTCKIVPPEKIGIPDNVCIYYIADDEVHKVHSAKEPPIKIANLPRKLTAEEASQGYETFLIFLSDEAESAKASLVERVWKSGYYQNAENITILPELAEVDNVVLTQFDESDKNSRYGNYYDRVGRPLGKAKDSNCRFKYGFYAEYGLVLLKRCENASRPRNISNRDAYGFAGTEWQYERRLFALGSPIALWGIKNIIQFENDTILFELRHRQLCLFDYRTRRIALLARGYGATAAIEEIPIQ